MADIAYAGRLASALLQRALDTFEQQDPAGAATVIRDDHTIDLEFDGLIRRLMTHMMEDARTISSAIDLVFVAKAIERVGDHAKNIGEQVVYAVQGDDVRHLPVPAVEAVVR
jgi:phosphate transport system protein